mmetsp:Transcript_25600/g.58141  ORF Transcript_25600/g.58141 Transcript_25600/m.58141 type:complete len:219 (+) Transcript_25600:86-742(+)
MQASDGWGKRSQGLPTGELLHLSQEVEGCAVAYHGTRHPRSVAPVQPRDANSQAILEEPTEDVRIASMSGVCLHARLYAVEGHLYMAMPKTREHADHEGRLLLSDVGLQAFTAAQGLRQPVVRCTLAHVPAEAGAEAAVEPREPSFGAYPLEGLQQGRFAALRVALDHLERADDCRIAEASERARRYDAEHAVVAKALDGHAVEQEVCRPRGRDCQQR